MFQVKKLFLPIVLFAMGCASKPETPIKAVYLVRETGQLSREDLQTRPEVVVTDNFFTLRRKMISRIWHGQTTLQNADKYEALLKEEIFVGIQSRRSRGFKGIQLLRREVIGEVEFITIMTFESLDAVREFAGEDYERAVVPEKARAILSHFDERSQHYEIRTEMEGNG